MAQSCSHFTFSPSGCFELAHDEDGQIVPIAHFNYAAVDRPGKNDCDDDGEDDAELKEEAMRLAVEALIDLLRWLWQNGMKNQDGMIIRTHIILWVFLKELHGMNLTELAAAFGKHKQSYGRWVDDFKRRYPHIRNPHMKE